MSDTEIVFCHDNLTIYYPTAPGRVYVIPLKSLADSDVVPNPACDAYWSTLTRVVDLAGMLRRGGRDLHPLDPEAPGLPARTSWLAAGGDHDDADGMAAAVDQWAGWCDRDSEARDEEEARAAIVRAA